MGRKIPGKKHRGVKDPAKQRARRDEELKGKVNLAPSDLDEQAFPRSLQRLIQLKDSLLLRGGRIQKRKKKKKKSADAPKLISVGAEQQFTRLPHRKSRPDKATPIFTQKAGESGERFLQRVNRETQAFVKETEFETKFNVQVKRDPKTGLIEDVIKQPKDEIDELAKLRAKHANVKKKKKKKGEGENGEEEVRLSKGQKRREKLLKKKQKKVEEAGESKEFRRVDEVKFGEVAHAPPQLAQLAKSKDKDCDGGAGKVKTSSLLLSSLLPSKSAAKPEKAKKSIDRSGKRRDLPLGERRQLEKQQSAAVAAYRQLKAKRLAD